MTEKTAIDTPEKGTSWRDKTLKAAGYSYIFGDLSMATAGKLRGERHTYRGAMAWLLGGIFAAVWGNPDPEIQLKIQASKLERYLKQKGVEIPDDARAQSRLLEKKSFLGHVSQFLYEHPSEMLNTMYGVGAAMMLHGSLKPEARTAKAFFPKKLNLHSLVEINSNFWIGAIVLAGASLGLLVKEDPDAQKKAEGKGALAKLHAFVAEKPLRVTSALYGVNNLFLFAKFKEDVHLQNSTYAGKMLKPHQASGAQLAAYLFSNTMLFLSNRSQISDKGFGAEDVAQLESAAAHVIAAQPPEKQRELLADVAQYISKEKGVKLSAPAIAQHLADRITLLTQERLQPVVNEAKWVAREAARPSVLAQSTHRS